MHYQGSHLHISCVCVCVCVCRQHHSPSISSVYTFFFSFLNLCDLSLYMSHSSCAVYVSVCVCLCTCVCVRHSSVSFTERWGSWSCGLRSEPGRPTPPQSCGEEKGQNREEWLSWMRCVYVTVWFWCDSSRLNVGRNVQTEVPVFILVLFLKVSLLCWGAQAFESQTWHVGFHGF